MATVTILHGRNSVNIEDRVQRLLFEVDPQRFSTTVIELESATPDALLSAVSTPAFFGSTRVLHLRGIPSVDKSSTLEWDDLESLLQGALQDSLVILTTSQKIPSNRRILKSAQANGWIVENHDVPYGQEMASWTTQRFQANGVEIERRAVQAMLERLYPGSWQREDRWNPQPINMRLLATEVDKLTTAAAPGPVSVSHVVALTPDRSGVTAFKLNDETFGGRVEGALVELDNVLSSGEAPERVIGQIGYQPLVFLAARQVQRYGPDTASEAAGVSAGQLKATLGRKAGWDNGAATGEAIEELRRAEWLVKTGRSTNSATVLAPLVGSIADRFKKR